MPLNIRHARPEDGDSIWAIIGPTIRAGETYTLNPEMDKTEALAYWLGADKTTLVAEEGNQVVGTYYLKANQAGGGAHIANCGYMTSALATGRGIARKMCLHSLDEARSRGFKGMQFNFVVSTNERALRLWQSLGFEIVGQVPLAFNHPTHGYVDAFVMFRSL